MFFLAKFLRDKTSKKLNKGGDEEKPFLAHLEDLRGTLFKMIITLFSVTILCFVFNKQLLDIIQWPLQTANVPDDAKQLGLFGVVEPMMLAIKVSFYAGIILSLPVLLYFLGEFILPGLKENEKKLILPSLLVGAALFAVGVCFSYFVVIPRAIEFFYGFGEKRSWVSEMRASYYISFAVQMVLVFGISFELPVVVMGLVKLEILSHRVMHRTRSTAIVVMVIVSAVVTPTTDVFTLSLLAGPLIVLYEICIWLAWWLEKKRAREERRERERALPEAEPMDGPDPDTDPTAPPEGGGDGDGSGSSGGVSIEKSAATPLVSPDPDHVDSDHLESTGPTYDPDNALTEDASEVEPDISPDGEVSKVSDSGDSSESSDDPAHSGSGDDYWNDPYHHDHHDEYHHDDYYSGPTEELKRELREELTQLVKAEVKAELRQEILAEIRQELRLEAKPRRRIGLDPRRTRRPR